jgi:NAD(P)-dependent dehydrogenase (short-subunit alcohol dehydrogenase family)
MNEQNELLKQHLIEAISCQNLQKIQKILTEAQLDDETIILKEALLQVEYANFVWFLLEYVGSTPGWGIYSSTKFAVEGITEALHDELAPLGIHATVVEPGYFRTNFLDGSSLQRTAMEIPDYVDTVGKVRKIASDLSYQQPGDPTKLAQAMLQRVNEKRCGE